MCGSPISGSDYYQNDPVQDLWRLSAQVNAGHDLSNELKAVVFSGLSPLEKLTCLSVQRHLAAALALLNGKDVDDQTFRALLAGWDEVLNDLRHDASKLTPRSHAFHMRLASKYADYYRSFEQKSVEQWVSAARFKGDFLRAVALARRGEPDKAARLVGTISNRWRESIPVRLPGLYVIESTGSGWAARTGNAILAQQLSDKACEGNGRLAPYQEDGPELAKSPRSVEATLRFGFAAAVLPTSLTE